MQFGFRLDTSAFNRFVDALSSAVEPTNPSPVQDGLLAASNEYMSSERTRFSFASHGDGTWQELAESTIKKRVSKGQEEPLTILHDKGDLELSLHRGAENHVLQVTANGVIEGTEDPTARYHQDGTDRMPARPILVAPTAEALDAMKPPLVHGLQEAVSQSAKA